MLFVLGVTLFTSRIVLHTLGIEDFGIYNIVGGVVVLFSFINNAMSTGTQRHISYELGKKNGNIKEVFSNCLVIHVHIALFIILLAETIGLWFLNTQMNFPEHRMNAVNWVYQLSILGCAFNIIRIPYQASIIAYERMSFYAYIGILETVFKLLIVYALIVFSFDKLILYAFLTLLVISLTTYCFYFFCKKNFKQIRYDSSCSKKRYKSLLSFSGWTMFGSIANAGIQQGINIIINIFYGVTLNAAIGIATQVNSAVTQFVGGFQQALNPQLVKSQAEKDSNRQYSLIQKSSKLSYYIMMVIALPIIINLDYILKLWLGEYPNHTASICSLIIIGALIECLSGPLWVSIFATGKIKTYQIVISSILLLNIPLSYFGGLLNMKPEVIFIIRNTTFACGFIIRLLFLRKIIRLNCIDFAKEVILPVAKVSFFTFVPLYLLFKWAATATSLLQLILQSAFIIGYELLIIASIGLKKEERIYIYNIVKQKIKK